MRTEICDRLGIEYPIFAFSHCRDVVAVVSKAGGLGVLGANGFTADQLEENLIWIDQHSGGNPYAVDIVIPAKYEGKGKDISTDKPVRLVMQELIEDYLDAVERLNNLMPE